MLPFGANRSGSYLGVTLEGIAAMSSQTEVYYYQYYTTAGMISLIPEEGGRYKVMFKSDNLGSYHSAESAADDVSGGHTFSPSEPAC